MDANVRNVISLPNVNQVSPDSNFNSISNVLGGETGGSRVPFRSGFRPALDNTTDISYTTFKNLSNCRFKGYRLRRTMKFVIARFDNDNRVCGCGNRKNKPGEGVPILLSKQVNGDVKAHYRNVMRCGNAWLCPVCSFKIQMVRADCVRQVIKRSNALGHSLDFLTLTASHCKEQSFSEIFSQVKGAFEKLANHRKFRYFKRLLGFEYFQSFDLKYNHVNGWHPHFHFLFISEVSEADMGLQALKTEFFNWLRSYWCELNKGSTLVNQVLIPATSNSIADYLNKVGLADEVTRSNNKEGYNTYTPFQLLEFGHYDLFWEYAQVTKNKNAFSYSKFFFKKYAASFYDDKEAMEIADEVLQQLCILGDETYDFILKHGLEAEVLEYAERGQLGLYFHSKGFEYEALIGGLLHVF